MQKLPTLLTLVILPTLGTMAVSTALGAKGDTGTKKPAAGVFCLMPGDRSGQKTPDLRVSKAWKVDSVDGVRLRTFWDKLEPQKGEFNWSHLDQGLELAEQSGKLISFSVGAGMATPDWVYQDQGAEKFTFTLPAPPAGESSPREPAMPLPWDKRFQQAWGSFIHASADRYDGHPRLAYVVMAGFGPLIESYLVKTREDVERIQARGGMEKWVEASRAIIDLYADAYEQTPFILAVGEPIRTPEGREALDAVVRYGVSKYPGRFGVMHCALSAREGRNIHKDRMISSNAKKVPVGLQFIWGMSGRNSEWVGGTLAQALDRAESMDAHFVEVYRADCENPAYAETIAGAGKRLKANQSLLER